MARVRTRFHTAHSGHIVNGRFLVSLAILFTFTVCFVASAQGQLEILTDPLQSGTIGSDFFLQLEAQGGERPYSWVVVDGELPRDLQISSEGIVSGQILEYGDFIAVLEVTDATRPTPHDRASNVAVPGRFGVVRESDVIFIGTGIDPRRDHR